MTPAPDPIPLVDLAAQQAEIFDALAGDVERVLRTAAFIGGPDVAGFESEYAAYTGTAHCVGVANGTDAVELALRAVGVTRDDEVILPANTFIATVEAVARIGAMPVLVDVHEDTLLIDAEAVARALGPRTRAVVPVHLFGQVAAVDEVERLVAGSAISIVGDAAQAQGATRLGVHAGALGRLAGTSFYPGKNLGAAGDAGAVTTDDPELARRLRLLANHGSATKYVHETLGFNSRLDALQAVVLRHKLRRLDAWNTRRRELADTYLGALAGLPGVTLPVVDPDGVPVWHLFVLRVQERDKVLSRLHDAGIGAGIHYPYPVHLTEAFSSLGRPGDFPVSEAAAADMLSLPLYPHLSPEQQERVVEAFVAALEPRAVAG